MGLVTRVGPQSLPGTFGILKAFDILRFFYNSQE